MRIYVGNLAPETGVKDLRALFEPHGEVRRARLARDRETGALRGFAIVEMEDASARTAIAALSGASAGGRTLKVKEARPRPPRPPANGAPPTDLGDGA
jgi:RNA recognition motif-containing protein